MRRFDLMRLRQLATVLTAGLLVGPAMVRAAPDPWFGVWRLDPARSTQRAEPSPYRRVTLRIEPAGDGLAVIYDMVGTRGGVTHLEWTGRFDARDYPVQGVDYVLTNAYRRIGDRSYEIVVKVDGQLAATAVAVISPDGKTLTVRTAERDPQGHTVDTTSVYEREPGSGFRVPGS